MRNQISLLIMVLFVSSMNFVNAQNWNHTLRTTVPNTIGSTIGSEYYGSSVSLYGDYAVIGSSSNNFNNFSYGTGAVYVFKKTNGNWQQIKKITASDKVDYDNFGTSVAINGNTIVVGADGQDYDVTGTNRIPQSGAIYIFEKDRGGIDNWGEVKKIVASDRGEYDYFGTKVSMSNNTLIVTSPYKAIYVFQKDQDGINNWGFLKKIIPSDKEKGDQFGSISLHDNTLVVGTPDKNEMGKNGLTYGAGSVYIFQKDQGGDNNWGLLKKLFAPEMSLSDKFGHSVSVHGNTIAVGASNEDSSEKNPVSDAGSVYIFEKGQGGDNNWGLLKKIVASDRGKWNHFANISIYENTIVVGANSDGKDASGIEDASYLAGSLYIYQRNQGGINNWGQVKKLVATKRGYESYFGTFLTIYNNTILVGCSSEDKVDSDGRNRVSNTGAAYFIENNCLKDNLSSLNTTVNDIQLLNGPTFYYDSQCNIMAYIQSSGNTPIRGSVNAKVWRDLNQPMKYVKRHYEITPTTNANTSTGRVTLYFSQADFDDFNNINTDKLPVSTTDLSGKINLRILKISGTSSDGTGSINSYGSNTKVIINPDDNSIIWNQNDNRWEITFDVTGFSGFFIQTSSSSLPLSLIEFTAKPQYNNAIVKWESKDETNHSRYEIQRSFDGQYFSAIGTRKGKNILTALSYDFVDYDIRQKINIVYYRLKMVATDESFEYSPIVSVNFNVNESENIRIFPNPTTGFLSINSSERLIQEIQNITLTDISGKVVLRNNVLLNFQNIDISYLQEGMYFLSLHYLSGQKQTFKIIKR
jgi:FG-GAP repeat/Secretion system C-terminal sorting domain